MNEQSIEFVESFFNDSAIKIPEKFYRVKKGGSRYYVDSEFNLKIGITSFLSKILPENYYLQLWKKEVGEKNAAQILKDRANYGTMFHILTANVLRSYITTKAYKIPLLLHQIDEELQSFGFEAKGYELTELQSDLASFAQFCEAYKPEPILLETPLASKDMPLAATLDFFGTIEIEVSGFFGEVYKSGVNKGEPKKSKQIERVHAVIDFKTMIKKESNYESNKAIGVSNKFQLNYQRLFLVDTYPEFADKNILMFNAIPKNWISNPSMQLTEINLIPDSALYGLYDASIYIDPYIVEKTADSNVVEFVNYNGNISESVKQITFKEYCKNLIKSHYE